MRATNSAGSKTTSISDVTPVPGRLRRLNREALTALTALVARYGFLAGAGGLVGIGMLVIAVGVRTAVVESLPYGRLIDLARDIERVESRWLAEAGRIRGDAFAEYETATGIRSEIGRIEHAVPLAVQEVPGLPARLGAGLEGLVDHVIEIGERVERIQSDLPEVQRLTQGMYVSAAEIIQALEPGQGSEMAQALLGAVATVHGYTEGQPPSAEQFSDRLQRVRAASAGASSALEGLAGGFVSYADALADRHMAAREGFAEIQAATDEGAREVDRLVREVRDAWLAAIEPPVWGLVLIGILLVGGGAWMIAFRAIKSRRPTPAALPASSANGREADPTPSVIARTAADRMATAARDIRGRMSSLRRIPLYAQGAGTAGANALDVVQDLSEEIAKIAEKLRAFSNAGSERPQTVAIRSCLDTAVAAAKETVGGGRATFEMPEGDASVLASPAGLRIAVGHVLANAVEAAPGKALIRIALEVDAESSMATVVVKDNGAGWTEEVRARAFDPFFTTKVGHAGVGLTVANILVRSWGGSVALDPPSGEGETVRISLQLAREDDAGTG